MNELPEDLTAKIIETFDDADVRAKVIASLEDLKQINVGLNQLRRAIVFLADGDYERFVELRRSFMGDPRDLLCAANSRQDNKEYWFSTSFDDMGAVKES